jgi:hypothetical protein
MAVKSFIGLAPDRKQGNSCYQFMPLDGSLECFMDRIGTKLHSGRTFASAFQGQVFESKLGNGRNVWRIEEGQDMDKRSSLFQLRGKKFYEIDKWSKRLLMNK